MEKAKVYFTSKVTPKDMIEIYEKLGVKLTGKVAVKLHSGEKGNQNYLRPEFVKEIVKYVNGTVVECNTAYGGARNTSEKHKELLKEHGWNKYFDVDLMDEEGPDKVLKIENGKVLKENYVGKNIDKVVSKLHNMEHEDLLIPQNIAKALGYKSEDSYEEVNVYTRGYRILNKVPRMPSNIVENVVKRFKSFQNLLVANIAELDDVEGIGEIRARTIKQSLKRMREQFAFDNLLI